MSKIVKFIVIAAVIVVSAFSVFHAINHREKSTEE